MRQEAAAYAPGMPPLGGDRQTDGGRIAIAEPRSYAALIPPDRA
jgi:hypothetical protein